MANQLGMAVVNISKRLWRESLKKIAVTVNFHLILTLFSQSIAEIKAWSKSIVKSQAAEISLMQDLLKTL